MLITQEVESGASRQGSFGVSLSQLRDQLACPAKMTNDSRQRLLELDERLKRLTALGDERFRVGFSDEAIVALQGAGAVA